MGTSLNKTTAVYLKNNSGQTVTKGDVVILDKTLASSFTLTGSSQLANAQIGVILDQTNISNGTSCLVVVDGYVPVINLISGASLGDSIGLSSVAKKAISHATILAGDFGRVLSSGITPDAILGGIIQPPSSVTSGVTSQYHVKTLTPVVVNPDPVIDTLVDSLTLTFTLTATSDILVIFSVNKTGAHPDKYAVYDGVTKLSSDEFYDFSSESGANNWGMTHSDIFTLSSGSHTINIKGNAALSTAQITFNDRSLIVQVLG